jgi:PiT family inorganic phosphate transporter
MGGEVAKTVGQGVVNLKEWDEDSDLLAIAMTAVLAGAGISTASATAFGLPVSATHGAISGLAAVAMYERGTDAVNGRGLAFTVFGWVASPLVGGIVGGSLSALLERRIFCAANPAAEAHRMRPTLVGGTLGLVVVFLCTKGPMWLRLPWWGDLLAFVATFGISGASR